MRMNQRKVLIEGRFLEVVHKYTNQSGVIGVGSLGIFKEIVVLRSPNQMLLVKMNKMMSLNGIIVFQLKTLK